MEKEQIKKEIQKLQEELNFHNYKYYVENNPIISDYEYDQLLKKLEKLEKENPEFKTADSPTQRIGGQPLEGFKTVSVQKALKKCKTSAAIRVRYTKKQKKTMKNNFC